MMFQKVVNRNVRGKKTIPDLSSVPIVGLPLVGRDDRVMGSIFDLTSLCFRDCGSTASKVGLAGSGCEKCTVARLRRISSSLWRLGAMAVDGDGNCANRAVIVKIEVGQLSKALVLCCAS